MHCIQITSLQTTWVNRLRFVAFEPELMEEFGKVNNLGLGLGSSQDNFYHYVLCRGSSRLRAVNVS